MRGSPCDNVSSVLSLYERFRSNLMSITSGCEPVASRMKPPATALRHSRSTWNVFSWCSGLRPSPLSQVMVVFLAAAASSSVGTRRSLDVVSMCAKKSFLESEDGSGGWEQGRYLRPTSGSRECGSATLWPIIARTSTPQRSPSGGLMGCHSSLCIELMQWSIYRIVKLTPRCIVRRSTTNPDYSLEL